MEDLVQFAKKTFLSGFGAQEGCSVSVRTVKGMRVTATGTNFDSITQDDIVDISRDDNVNKEFATHLSIYQALPQVKVILHLKPSFALAASKINVTIRPSTELHGEVIGKKLTVSTTIPERIVECLVKARECLALNSGLVVVGRTLDEAYARALMIENAIFTYMAAELLSKRAPANKIPVDKLYKAQQLAPSDYEYNLERDSALVGLNKLLLAIRELDEDNKYIYARMPIFVGVFAHSKLNIDKVRAIEYDTFDNAKYLASVARAINDDGVALLRGRGLVVCDDNDDIAKATIARIEQQCREQVVEMLRELGAQGELSASTIIELFAQSIGSHAIL